LSYDWIGSTVLNPLGYAAVGPIAGTVGVERTLLAAARIQFFTALLPLASPAVRERTATVEPSAA
jgi:hypothetical protein